MCKLELTEAERQFMLVVFEAGIQALGITTLAAKLRGLKDAAPAPVVEPAPAPAPVVEPAVDAAPPAPAAAPVEHFA